MLHHPRRLLVCLFFASLLGLALGLTGCAKTQGQPRGPVNSDGYLFCFWNVENLFDDKEDGRRDPDRQYDTWFANDSAAREKKYSNLSKALIALNDGKGPDILALAEVESVRAAELLRDALNKRLSDPALHYQNVLMKE